MQATAASFELKTTPPKHAHNARLSGWLTNAEVNIHTNITFRNEDHYEGDFHYHGNLDTGCEEYGQLLFAIVKENAAKYGDDLVRRVVHRPSYFNEFLFRVYALNISAIYDNQHHGYKPKLVHIMWFYGRTSFERKLSERSDRQSRFALMAARGTHAKQAFIDAVCLGVRTVHESPYSPNHDYAEYQDANNVLEAPRNAKERTDLLPYRAQMHFDEGTASRLYLLLKRAELFLQICSSSKRRLRE